MNNEFVGIEFKLDAWEKSNLLALADDLPLSYEPANHCGFP